MAIIICVETTRHIPALDIHHALRRLLRRYATDTARLEHGLGVTSAQFTCLQVIAERDRVTQIELAHWADVSPSTLVGHLDRLEGKGLVRRERDPEDRRRIHLHATDAGREAVRHAPVDMQQHVGRAVSHMQGPEQAALAAALAHLVDLLDSAAREPAASSSLHH